LGCALLGISCLLWYASGVVRASHYQSQKASELVTARQGAQGSPQTTRKALPAPERLRPGDVVGRLEIPRLGVSVMVTDGDDDATLAKAAGHLPDTALPCEEGNSAVAGHRDTFFRPVKNLRVHDRLRFVTPQGNFSYTVLHTFIVDPDELWVLQSTGGSMLTLITCYPFSYVGHAPKRYVVQAKRIEEQELTTTPPEAPSAVSAPRNRRRSS